ncbi:hypothetical protein EVAR_66116_1 [Eumeta japonica]|uniref:Uncharacterized protein n=1 Tax=Eumeta variegata TaxID=151549 RepID=A0A4C2A9Q5_EUMVA|nr:hypothetical protein EVAR_66116_1 [Eumeta japonica]
MDAARAATGAIYGLEFSRKSFFHFLRSASAALSGPGDKSTTPLCRRVDARARARVLPLRSAVRRPSLCSAVPAASCSFDDLIPINYNNILAIIPNKLNIDFLDLGIDRSAHRAPVGGAPALIFHAPAFLNLRHRPQRPRPTHVRYMKFIYCSPCYLLNTTYVSKIRGTRKQNESLERCLRVDTFGSKLDSKLIAKRRYPSPDGARTKEYAPSSSKTRPYFRSQTRQKGRNVNTYGPNKSTEATCNRRIWPLGQ